MLQVLFDNECLLAIDKPADIARPTYAPSTAHADGISNELELIDISGSPWSVATTPPSAKTERTVSDRQQHSVTFDWGS